MEEVNGLDRMLDCVEINNVTEFNDTLSACAVLVAGKPCKRKSLQEITKSNL